MVERNAREEMVNNVELDDTMEQLTADKSKVSVNSGQSALFESPCALLEVLGLVVVVVKVGNSDEPVVDPKVRKTVEQCNLSQTHNLSGVVKTVTNSEKTEIRNQNSQSLRRKVDGGHGREMTEVLSSARILGKCQTLVAGRCVEEHVSLPADELMSNKEDQADNRGILSHVEDLLDLRLNFSHGVRAAACLGGNKGSVLLHMVGVSVMSSMAVFPREVRNTQEAVHDETECVVGSTVVEHGLVTALVGQNPDTDKNESLEDTVEGPESTSQSESRCVLDLTAHVEHGADKSNVSHDVAHRSAGRLLEAVLGDCGPQRVN